MQQLSLWAAGDIAHAPTGERGLIVHRASRTESLAARLMHNLARSRPANPLQPQRIVVAHAGLGRWLLGEFARDTSRGKGIAANFELIPPWKWLELTARTVLGDEDLIGGAYRRELLRWHVFAALAHERDAQLADYLRDADGERRRYQLAEHLAGVFEQYLIYRPDWIVDWERGAQRDDWQANVWRRVSAAIAQPHRAQRPARLLRAIERDGDGETQPLHVFGVNHLAPDVLAALRVVALRRCVHVYFPDPCREHWVHFVTRRKQLGAGDDAALYFEVGHPLLAALGRTGQEFCMALDDADAQIERDPGDDAEPPPQAESLLAALQSSVRCAEPELVGVHAREAAASAATAQGESDFKAHLLAMREDASLRVHACHTRLRELEVLRDALLGMLADDPTLAHRDIVVMAPDIAAYAASLPAVFGAAAHYDSDRAHIPWHLADVTLARTHPLMSAFARLLDLGESRFAASEVFDLLDVPALARRFGIDAQARETLERCVRRARIAWGLDADMKQRFSGAAIAQNSWQFGFDRLFAGAIAGDAAAGVFADVLPVEGISGSVAEAVGNLDQLLDTLRDMRNAFVHARPLAAWSNWLLDRLDALFRVDFADAEEIGALDALRRALASLKTQGEAAGAVPLPWSVMRDAVRDALGNASERQPFLLGGVTFCGLVPQRAIPFRVVCVLGMNEGEFPRTSQDLGINRMLAAPRRGDRQTRSEDRYLFLEALMSARSHLHISFLGESVRDGKRCNPAAPLAELLQFLDEQHDVARDAQLPRPWLVRHPLQPFDLRYYDRLDPQRDPRLFSYVHAFAGMPRDAAPAAAFLPAAPMQLTDTSGDNDVSLAALRRFWRNPAKSSLRDLAGISLAAADDDAWPDREPLEARTDRRERVELKLLLDALLGGNAIPESAPPRLALSGMLPAGAAGHIAYDEARACAAAMLAVARPLLGTGLRRSSQAIDVDLGADVRLSGVVEDLLHNADGATFLFAARASREAHFGDLVPLYIDYAALRLAGVPVRVCFVENDKNAKSAPPVRQPALLAAIAAQDDGRLRDGLRQLVEISRSARAQPPLFLPDTAWKWASETASNRPRAARLAWLGDRAKSGERNHSPGYAGLLARELDLLDPASSAHARFVAVVQRVSNVLDPQRQVLLREDSSAGRRVS